VEPGTVAQGTGKVLKNNNGAKKAADFLPVRQLAVTLHKN
jgi:hypothetical protein